MSEDIRVLLVKLADRLHNMRTLHFIKSPDKRRRIARETMDIYAPLAERVGMYEYMREMQLLAFEQLEPEAYATITGRLEQIRSSEGGQVDAIALKIKQALAEAGLKVEVWGREKHPYSIWRKMAERHVSFEQITDIMAFRVLTESLEDCYRAIGVLHQAWQFVPGPLQGLHNDDVVFLYAGTREQAEAARDLVLSLAQQHDWKLEVDFKRWHTIADEWEDPDLPLPESEAAKLAEHEELIATERRQTEESGHPEYEVRVDLPSLHDAFQFADTLRDEGLPVVHRWKYLLIGVPDEDSGKELVERIQEQAPPDSQVSLEGTWAVAYAERPPNPFAIFGGMGG